MSFVPAPIDHVAAMLPRLQFRQVLSAFAAIRGGALLVFVPMEE